MTDICRTEEPVHPTVGAEAPISSVKAEIYSQGFPLWEHGDDPPVPVLDSEDNHVSPDVNFLLPQIS
jgi:hypothetical protein